LTGTESPEQSPEGRAFREGGASPPEARRGTGEPLHPQTATPQAERPKGAQRQRVRRLLGNGSGRGSRRAEGQGPLSWALPLRRSYFERPFDISRLNGYAGYLWTSVQNRGIESDLLLKK